MCRGAVTLRTLRDRAATAGCGDSPFTVSQTCYTVICSLSSFIVASTMACLVPATLTVVRDWSWYTCF